MTKDKYHHGTLKQDLISKGLELLNKEGLEGFSLRKVAALCGVSHTAPYKHFKDKDELIQAIAFEVIEAFRNSLLEPTIKFPDNPRRQIIEMGKSYVRFMVENPDYLKFLFLTEHKGPSDINNNEFSCHDGTPFEVFRKSSEFYMESINLDKEHYTVHTLAMWSLVHGVSLLIVNKAVTYDGDYMELVEKMLNEEIV